MSIASRSRRALGRRHRRRRALRDHVLRPPHGSRRVHGEDLADDEPVTEHADRSQVLLDRGHRSRVRPDVGRYVERRDRLERQPPRLAPGQELPHRPPVGRPRPPVGDPRREELEKLPHRRWPRVDDQPRQRQLRPLRGCRSQRVRRLDPHQVFAHSRTAPPPPAESPSTATRIPVSRALRIAGDDPFAARLLAAEGGALAVPAELAQEFGPRQGQDVPGPAGPEGRHQLRGADLRDAEEVFDVAAREVGRPIRPSIR